MARLRLTMAFDSGPVARLTADLLDLLDQEYDGRADADVQLRAVLIAVDIGAKDEDGDQWTHVRFQFGTAPDFKHATSSTAYMAGVAAEVLESAVAGGPSA